MCDAVTKDLMRIVNEERQGVDGMMQYVKDTISISCMPTNTLTSGASQRSESMLINANRTDAAAELAAKEALQEV